MSISKTYYANGKLLLTGEYLVLHGAKAIALPLKVGQKLTISEKSGSNSIHWKAFYDREIWFSCELKSSDFSVLQTSHQDKAETLSKIFQTVKILNPEFSPLSGTAFETVLEANPKWGFGSSSTLVSLLSQYAEVDPFALNSLIFKGSGFDIACATADGPIFYIKDELIQPIELEFPFSDQLFLLYSGKKKKTAREVNTFLKEKILPDGLIQEVSALAEEFANCCDQKDFNQLIRIHEQLIGKVIGKTPVKPAYFPDFNGEIKSLGAWGGDFYLISTELSLTEVKKFFEPKGLTTVFRWEDLILKRKKA